MNATKASCGHAVVAVGAPGSPARYDVESRPCKDCVDLEGIWLAALLKSHPEHGKRAICISECLRHPEIPNATKEAYQVVFKRNYPASKGE